MDRQKTISFMLTLPKSDRDLLIRMAARRCLQDPDCHATAAGIGREIIGEYLDEYRQEAEYTNTIQGGDDERYDL